MKYSEFSSMFLGGLCFVLACTLEAGPFTIAKTKPPLKANIHCIAEAPSHHSTALENVEALSSKLPKSPPGMGMSDALSL